MNLKILTKTRIGETKIVETDSVIINTTTSEFQLTRTCRA
jgi:hypothetical protein